MTEIQHLKINLEEIKSATENFLSESIGKGGFGKVYKGELTRPTGTNIVAIKRLIIGPSGQGFSEFLKEIDVLSRYKHHNLISLLGYCDEPGEKILVYEFASNGSLDQHLRDPGFTWTQRLKICVGVAKGILFLHKPNETHQRVLHCDIKSSNILLDEKLEAKLADFGLATLGPADQPETFLLTGVQGTQGYCDPVYYETYILTKESDIYSFGVVLLEVLSGRLCIEVTDNKVQMNMPKWQESYKHQKLEEIVCKDLMKQIDRTSLKTFSDIAFQCLENYREKRPTISLVLENLELALKSQELHDIIQRKYGEILKSVVIPLEYRSIEELHVLLFNGVFLDNYKKWFYLNEEGQHCVMISMKECLIPIQKEKYYLTCNYNSRFPEGSIFNLSCRFKTRVRTQFLSPDITYMVNLVFKHYKYEYKTEKYIPICIKYKLDGEKESSISYLAHKKKDNWWMVELFQFTNDRKTVDLQIIFEGCALLIVEEGIEFQPLEKAVGHQVLEGETEKEANMQSVPDSDDTYWEQKLPNDYKDIIKWSMREENLITPKKRFWGNLRLPVISKWKGNRTKVLNNKERLQSKDGLQWRTKKELYDILRTGFLTNNDREWFFLDDNGKRCRMLSAKAVFVNDGEKTGSWKSLPKSRFGDVYVGDLNSTCLRIHHNIKSQEISPETTYACYLVYKLPVEDKSHIKGPMKVKYDGLDDYWYVYLVSPQIPVIGKVDQNIYDLSRPKKKGIPQPRSDGWMEVQVWEFQTGITTKMIHVGLSLKERCGFWFNGFVIQGIEFRPI